MSNPDGVGRAIRAALLVGLLIAAAVGAQAFVRPEPIEAPAAEAPTDSEPTMDLAHLRSSDVEFLTSVLSEGSDAGRLSAVRALVISGDLRGARPLFDAAETRGDVYCEAALEVLREQTPLDAWRELAIAPEVCGVEERLAAAEGQLSDEDIALLVEDADGRIRARARERLSR